MKKVLVKTIVLTIIVGVLNFLFLVFMKDETNYMVIDLFNYVCAGMILLILNDMRKKCEILTFCSVFAKRGEK